MGQTKDHARPGQDLARRLELEQAEHAALKQAVLTYLERPSEDGAPIRQALRRELAARCNHSAKEYS